MRFLFLLFLSVLPILSFSQDKLWIEGFLSSDYNKQFTSVSSPLETFNGMIGDTIIFRGSTDRADFLKNDTLWIKKGSKKPVKGKHFKITNHYKSNGDYTNGEFIYNIPWVVVSCFKGTDESFILPPKFECMTLKNIQTGDIVNWRYLFDYDLSDYVDIINVTKSHSLSNELKNKMFFERNGVKFDEIKVDSAVMTISSDKYCMYIKTNVFLNNHLSYIFPEKSYDYNKLLYTEEAKDLLLERLRNTGHFDLVLSKVVKPKNAQIRYGKMQTVSDKSVTRYSYIDNFISIVWLARKSEFSFSLQNKSGSSLKIEWDEGAYIDMSNSASRIFHSGVKYLDRDKSMPATVVPNGTSVEDVVLPTNLTSFNNSDWHSSSLIPKWDVYDAEKIGKTVKVLLPISVKGIINEYTFIFKTEWIWDHPELRN